MWLVSAIVQLNVTFLGELWSGGEEVEGFNFWWSILSKFGHFYWIRSNFETAGETLCNELMGADERFDGQMLICWRSWTIDEYWWVSSDRLVLWGGFWRVCTDRQALWLSSDRFMRLGGSTSFKIKRTATFTPSVNQKGKSSHFKLSERKMDEQSAGPPHYREKRYCETCEFTWCFNSLNFTNKLCTI